MPWNVRDEDTKKAFSVVSIVDLNTIPNVTVRFLPPQGRSKYNNIISTWMPNIIGAKINKRVGDFSPAHKQMTSLLHTNK